MTPYTFAQRIIVSPPGAAAYEARYAQPGQRGSLYVRGPQGLHEVPASRVTPRVLGLGRGGRP